MAVGINAIGNTPGGQMAGFGQMDVVGKNIENKISDAQRQMQKLSSDEDAAVKEKNPPQEENLPMRRDAALEERRKRQELEREISGLNAQLRQHQAELRREEQRESVAVGMRSASTEGEETGRRNTENTDMRGKSAENSDAAAAKDTDKQTAQAQNAGDREKEAPDGEQGLSRTGMRAIIGMDSVMEQVKGQRNVIARMEGGIAILKGEIRQDKNLGADTGKKEAELARREDDMKRLANPNLSGLGRAQEKVREALRPMSDKEEKKVIKNEAEGRVILKATNYSKEKNHGHIYG